MLEIQWAFFYVLRCKDNSLYAGFTLDLTKRLDEHNSGSGAKYTRPMSRRPLEIVHYERFCSKSDAMKQEYAFKQLQKREKEAYLDFFVDLKYNLDNLE